VDAANLEARLQALVAQPNAPAVHVRPDPLVDYRHVAAVLSASQRVGVTRIGIVGNERFL